MTIRLLFLFIFFNSYVLFSEEIIMNALKDSSTNQFLQMMLKSYWKRVSLPDERIPDIFQLLEKYGEEGESAMLLLHEKYNDMLDPNSSFNMHYKQARAQKFQAYAQSLLPYIKNGVLLDFGAGDTQLAMSLVSSNPHITHAYATDIFPFIPQVNHPRVSFLQQQSADSTPFEKESIDTVVLSTVLHHITPHVRRSLLSHLYSILKTNGRIILVEDSFPLQTQDGRNELEIAFFKLNASQRKDVLCFLDWWGNRLMKNRAEIPLPCTFKTIEDWIVLFEDFDFKLLENDFEGFPPLFTHMVSPKALLVFEKKLFINQPISEAIKVNRSSDLQTVCGILPKEKIMINLSIGGTKILANAVDKTGQIFYATSVYKWRDTEEAKLSRDWMVSKITQTIHEVAGKFLPSEIEGIGISWAGPVSQEGFVIGPNIHGFRFSDLSEEEKQKGGIDLPLLLSRHTPPDWVVKVLNDADEEALSELSNKGIKEGTLLIIGTGIGAGFIHEGIPYFGPENFLERMGEIGHHLVFNETTNSYEYYALETRGKILIKNNQRLTDRLSAPGIAKRFLYFIKGELQDSVYAYFSEGNNKCSSLEIQEFFSEKKIPLSLEEKILALITEKAKNNEKKALRFIQAVGFEIGRALQVFVSYYPNSSFLQEIYLSGSLGRLFGKDVEHEPFLKAIERGLRPMLPF